MIEKLTMTAKQIADEILDLSTALERVMEQWSDTDQRPNGLSATECVGFITKESTGDDISITVDLQAPSDGSEALLRTWAIASRSDANNIERFDNIQLTFAVDYDSARAVTQKAGEATRDDLRTLLRLPETKLMQVVVSDQSGLDKTTGESLGQRYELDDDREPTQPEGSIEVIDATVHTVLSKLKQSVTD